MHGGPTLDPRDQQPISLDGGTDISLGADGQVQIADSAGGLSHTEVSDITAAYASQASNTQDTNSKPPQITQTQLVHSMPKMLSGTGQLVSPTSNLGFTLPAPTLLTVASFVSDFLPSIASTPFVDSLVFPSVTPSTTGAPTSAHVSSWSFPPLPGSFSLLSSTVMSNSGLGSSSSVTSSAASVTSSISSAATTSASSMSSLNSSQSTTRSSSSANTPSGTAAVSTGNFDIHRPEIYAGIGIGTIIIVGVIAALVAWVIRCRYRRKRRARVMVPWGRPEDGDSGLEAGYGASDMDSAAVRALNLGSREDLAHIQAWSPRGDRDVGEPKRADGYFNGPFYGLPDVPRHDHYEDSVFNGLPTFYQGSGTSVRNLPEHLIADDVQARHHRGGTFSLDEKIAYPEYPQGAFLAHNYPTRNDSYLNVRGRGEVSDEDALNSRQTISMAERLRNRDKSTAEPHGGDTGGDTGALPMPEAPTLGSEQVIEWGNSVKASLVNAFNAVAANIGSGAPQMKKEDNLTAPPRRSTRRSVKDHFDEKKTSRNGTVDSAASKPWSLEEIANGAGVVHLNLHGIPAMDPAISDLSQGSSHKILGKGGDANSTHEWPDWVYSSGLTGKEQIPLAVSSKPQPALILHRSSFARQKSTETVNGNCYPSRRSSVYSTLSARSGAFPEISSKPAGRVDAARGRKGTTSTIGEEDSVVIQPEAVSRLTSYDSSILATEGARSSTDELASRALQMRQRRLMDSRT